MQQLPLCGLKAEILKRMDGAIGFQTAAVLGTIVALVRLFVHRVGIAGFFSRSPSWKDGPLVNLHACPQNCRTAALWLLSALPEPLFLSRPRRATEAHPASRGNIHALK